MKLISICSHSHQRLAETWFLPTLEDDYELRLHHCDVRGEGRYMEKDWQEAVQFKSECIIDAIRANPGEIIVYSDVDVQFFGLTREQILESITKKDIVCQLDDPNGQLCTGFFAVRANDATLRLWQAVNEAIPRERRDQPAFNRLLSEMKEIRYGYLPLQFFGAGTFFRKIWKPDDRIYLPRRPLMFHANWTMGVGNKMRLHARVRRIVEGGVSSVAHNNLVFRLRFGAKGTKSSGEVTRRNGRVAGPDPVPRTRPSRVCLDASTLCQLKCPSCPTSSGAVGRQIGSGSLGFDDFASFIRRNSWVTEIELSNWGEIFLNKELVRILEHARDHAIAVTAGNGANLNTASDEVLEALVRYSLRKLTCSIDGASQETYSAYRKNGNFERVIRNIRKINRYKKQYGSTHPEMTWQFVAFGHNTHEIARARRMAERLDMRFKVKLSWDDLYTETFSPVADKGAVRRETGLGVADRDEYEEAYGRNYAGRTCWQLWSQPRINYDGRLLGCSINHWGDYGNVFEHGLEACLAGEKMTGAREMLMGRLPPQLDIPCSSCKIYHGMRSKGAWVEPPDSSRAHDGAGPSVPSETLIPRSSRGYKG